MVDVSPDEIQPQKTAWLAFLDDQVGSAGHAASNVFDALHEFPFRPTSLIINAI